jgi:AcrR family transcriptional regulator
MIMSLQVAASQPEWLERRRKNQYMKDASTRDSLMKDRPRAVLERRRTPRQARSSATVDAIFEGTIQVLLKDGPTRLNTTRVALRAGVSVGTLYQYFPNKQALLFAVLERHLEEIVDAIETACSRCRAAPAAEMAEAIVKAYVSAKTERCEVSRALYLVAVELDARELIEALTQRGEAAVAATLATVADGWFPKPLMVAQTLLAAITGTVRAFYERNLPPASGGEVERQLTVMCRSYLGSAGGAARRAA